MSQSTGASAPVVSTITHAFSPLVSRSKLLQVNAGLPAEDALNTASCYLAAAFDLASDINENDSDGAWATAYLIELAKALIDSIYIGNKGESS
jgi:hypothetical protein